MCVATIRFYFLSNNFLDIYMYNVYMNLHIFMCIYVYIIHVLFIKIYSWRMHVMIFLEVNITIEAMAFYKFLRATVKNGHKLGGLK